MNLRHNDMRPLCLIGTVLCLIAAAESRCLIACLNGGTCQKNDACECRPGFTGLYCQNDINECVTPGICGAGEDGRDRGKCVNTRGSYYCQCFPGFAHDLLEKDKGLGSKLCIDKDECAEDNGGCVNRACKNVMGAFYCLKCRPGWREVNKTHCEDIDECAMNKCINANCTNTNGSYHCECKQGFRYNKDHPDTCDDIDECSERPKICGAAAGNVCSNVPGTWKCNCPRGFEQVMNQGAFCQDIDECSKKYGFGGCEQNCVNEVGDYRCECYNKKRYKLHPNGRNCTDIDECQENGGKGPCVNSQCYNFVGGFTCLCPDGYKQRNGTYCVPDKF